MSWLSVLQLLLPIVVALLLLATTVRGMVRIWHPSADNMTEAPDHKATLTAGLLLLAACAAGAAFFALWGFRAHPGEPLGQALRYVFPTSIDADHYIQLAQYGYGNYIGADAMFPDQHLMIVFFPLFPALIGLVQAVTGLDGYIVGWAVQPILMGIAGAGLFRLIQPRFGKQTAVWTLLFLAAMPGSFFFAAPMTESLYLALTVWALVFIQEQKILPFVMVGFLAALTRSTGGLLAGAAVLVAIQYAREQKKPWSWLAASLGPCAGTGTYLLLNQYYYGNWFAFAEIQKSHWSQGLGWIGNTVHYLLDYIFGTYKVSTQFAIYVSLLGLVCILWACSMLFLSRKQLPVYWLGYGVAYVLVAYGTTWLLSAPRYALSLPLLPLGMALLCKKNWQRILFLGVEGWIGTLYLIQFLQWGPIY